MKNFFTRVFGNVNPAFFLIYIVSWNVLCLNDIQDENIMRAILGGLEISNAMELFKTGMWILLLVPILLCEGYLFSFELGLYTFSMHRSGYVRWWLNVLVSAAVHSILYLGVGVILMFIYYPNLNFDWYSLVCFAVHSYTLCVLMAALTIMFREVKISVLITVLLDGLCYTISVSDNALGKYLIGTWGMAIRSDVYAVENSFSFIAVIILQIALVAVSPLVIPQFLKKSDDFCKGALK